MSKDAYQPCPCGSGKKIKFCCKESAADIEKISKLIDADQRQAALELIDRLMAKKPDLQCLHAYKLQLTIGDPDRSAAKAAIDAFLKIAPTNPTALAAQAIRHAAEWDLDDDEPSNDETLRQAVAFMQRSLSNRGKYVTVLMLSAISIVGRRLLSEGKELAAAAHFHLAALFATNLDRPSEDILELMADPNVSLLVKNRIGLPDPPANVTWQNEYNTARLKAANGAWADAASALEGLAKTTLGEPLPRRAIGLLRAYLGDNKKAVELLRGTLGMDNVAETDAVDSEALSQLLDTTQRPRLESLELRCKIDNIDEVQEKLVASRQAVSLGDNLSHLSDQDGVPPLAAFWLIDRAQPENDEKLTLENTPRELAIVHLFGKQTDREARLEFVVESPNHEQAKTVLGEIVGQSVIDNSETVNSESFTPDPDLTQETLAFPSGTPLTVRKNIEAEANRVALNQIWPDQSHPALDDKTPREAAKVPAYQIRLKAAMMVLESQQLTGLDRELFQKLRDELGLPRTNDIVPRPGAIKRVPLVELARVDCQQLADGDVAAGFQYAIAHAATEAAAKFGEEILRRPNASLDVKTSIHFSLFRLASDPDVALKHLQEAQRLTKEAGQSPAMLMIQELSLRAMRHESAEFNQIYETIAKRHINEAGVREQLLSVMVRLGLLHPDGSPIQREPIAVGAPAGGSGESKVWTPDGSTGGSGSEPNEGKSKLWVPD